MSIEPQPQNKRKARRLERLGQQKDAMRVRSEARTNLYFSLEDCDDLDVSDEVGDDLEAIVDAEGEDGVKLSTLTKMFSVSALKEARESLKAAGKMHEVEEGATYRLLPGPEPEKKAK